MKEMAKKLSPSVTPIASGKVEYIYSIIKQRIISTQYPPGEILNENAIAEEFSVSRTPVREALRRLQQDKWLNILPKIGMQVQVFDVHQLKDLFNTKEALEALALKLAIDNATQQDISNLKEILEQLKNAADDDFDGLVKLDDIIHRSIWKIANNQMLFVYLPDLQDRLTRAWMHTRKQGMKIDKALLYGTFKAMIQSLEMRNKAMVDITVHDHIEYHRNEMRVCII